MARASAYRNRSRPGPDVKGIHQRQRSTPIAVGGGGNHRPTANPKVPQTNPGNQLELFPGPVPGAADCRRHDSLDVTRKGKLLGASRKLQKSQDLPVSPFVGHSHAAPTTPDPRRPACPAHVSPSLCATEQHRTTAPGPLIFRLSLSPRRLRPSNLSVTSEQLAEQQPTSFPNARQGMRAEGDSASSIPPEIALRLLAHCSPAIALQLDNVYTRPKTLRDLPPPPNSPPRCRRLDNTNLQARSSLLTHHRASGFEGFAASNTTTETAERPPAAISGTGGTIELGCGRWPSRLVRGILPTRRRQPEAGECTPLDRRCFRGRPRPLAPPFPPRRYPKTRWLVARAVGHARG